MGMTGTYRRPRLKLRFADPEYEGLVVYCRRPSIDGVLTLYRLRRYVTPSDELDDGVLGAKLGELFDTVAELITSWNLVDDDGGDVPRTGSALRSQDFSFVLALITAVLGAAVGVSRPLAQPSPGGDPSAEASLPMETSSASPPSTPTPD